MLTSIKDEPLSDKEVPVKTEASTETGSLCNYLRIERAVSLEVKKSPSDEEEDGRFIKLEVPETADSECFHKPTIFQDVKIKAEPCSDECSERNAGSQSLLDTCAFKFDEDKAAPSSYQNAIKTELDIMEDDEMYTDDVDSDKTNTSSTVNKMDLIFLNEDTNFMRKMMEFLSGPGAAENALRIFRHYGVIPPEYPEDELECPDCGEAMRVGKASRKFLGQILRCTGCGKLVAVQSGTMLEGIKLAQVGLDVLLLTILFFLRGDTLRAVSDYVASNKKTVTKLFDLYRYIISTAAWHNFGVLGGERDIVEVDETFIFKRKHNKGRVLAFQGRNHCLFGGISRSTRKVFGVVVPDRSTATLMPEMVRHIHPDSWIVSDSWRAYARSADYFRGHYTVNHKRGFLNPPRTSEPLWLPEGFFSAECEDGLFNGPVPCPNPPLFEPLRPFRIHTQCVERAWKELKRTLRKCRDPSRCSPYIGEWMWKQNMIPKDASLRVQFEIFMSCAKSVFPGPLKPPQFPDLDLCTCADCA